MRTHNQTRKPPPQTPTDHGSQSHIRRERMESKLEHTHTGGGREQSVRLPHPVSPTMRVTRFPFTFSTIFPRSASTASGARASPTRFSSASAMLRSPPPPTAADADADAFSCKLLPSSSSSSPRALFRCLPFLKGRWGGCYYWGVDPVHGPGPTGVWMGGGAQWEGAPTPGPRIHALPTGWSSFLAFAAGDKTVLPMGESPAPAGQPRVTRLTVSWEADRWGQMVKSSWLEGPPVYIGWSTLPPMQTHNPHVICYS